jgi:ankyrin repeat protein
MQVGSTPLFMACQNGHMEVVKLLLARSDIAVNQATVVRRVGRERGGREGGRGLTLQCCGGGRLTSQL